MRMTPAGPGVTALRALAQGSIIPPPYPSLDALTRAGLGPLLKDHIVPETSTGAAQLLTAADLTAQVLIGQLLTATGDILRSAQAAADQIVVLKGIAACRRHYPKPHQRLMGDIDILAPRELLPVLQQTLYTLGYVQRSELPADFYLTHHHGMPFVHPTSGIWVEIHTALLPPSHPVAQEPCFGMDHVLANTVPFELDGVCARALNDELHLLYTCTHWASALSIERGLIPLIDVIFLLRTNPHIDWQRLTEWLKRTHTACYVALMLGYLSTRSIVTLDYRALEILRDGLSRLGRANARLLCRIVDAFIVEREAFGRFATHYNTLITWDTLLRPRHPLRNIAALPLTLAFPPDRADRFSPALALRRLWAVIRP